MDATHIEISKENYYDLYNMAVCLLKAVDSLDPEKVHSMNGQRKTNDVCKIVNILKLFSLNYLHTNWDIIAPPH